MNKVIYKYLLYPHGKSVIEMPIGAELLHVNSQKNTICVWALVSPEDIVEERYFEVFFTGEDIHYDMGIERKYLGTCHTHSDSLVRHIFERIN